MKNRKFYFSVKNIWKNPKFYVPLLLLVALSSLYFRKVLDPEARRGSKKEFLVIHYTACPWPSGSAYSVAKFLQGKKNAGAHWVIDDKEWIQCADEESSVPAVGGRKWLGFVPKAWLKDKITNQNSINYEMCLGWGRDNVHIVDTTAKVIAWSLINRGLELGAVARHHEAKGKPCTFFGCVKLTETEWREFYKSPNPKTSAHWNQKYEDDQFFKFKKLVRFYQLGHLHRLGKIDWNTYLNFLKKEFGEKVAQENKFTYTF